MESEQRHYKLRSGSRSRSRTPLVQSHALIDSEISDRRCDPRTRSREGSRTPVDITHPRSKPVNSSKTNEHNTDTIVESQGGIVTVSPPLDATKKIERRSERQKAKRHLYANGQTGSKDNLAGSKTEKISKNASSHRILTSDYSSEEGDREDLSGRPSSAHEIYKQAGDWWNVFPKTDYTYSERSQCRYEVAPGVLAMPNMSRRSIRSNTDDTNLFSCCPSESDLYETADMSKGERAKAENRTLVDEHHESRTSKSNGKSEVLYAKARVERHSCHREIIYATSQSTANSGSRQQLSSDTSLKRYATRRYNVASSFDSDAESEDVVTSSHNNRLRRGAQQLVGSMSIIVLRLRKLFEFLKHTTIKRREYRATNDYRIHESKWFRMWRYLDRFFQYIYLFMVKVFFFDSWLLSRVSAVRKWIRHKSPMVLWVTVLPLLLLTGTYIVQKQSLIRLDSLHNISYDVTETSYRIFNDIIRLNPLQSDLLIEYIQTIKNLSVYLMPDMGVSTRDALA